MLAVKVKPPGESVWLPVDVNEEPQWNDNDPGGYGEATVNCDLDRGLRDRVEGGGLMIEGPHRPVFFGRVESFQGGNLKAFGTQAYLDDLMVDAAWGIKELSGFQQRPVEDPNKGKGIGLSVTEAQVLFPIAPNEALTLGSWNGAMLSIPDTQRVSVAFSCWRPAQAVFRLKVRAGYATGAAKSSEAITWADMYTKSATVDDAAATGTEFTNQSTTLTAAALGLAAINRISLEVTVRTPWTNGGTEATAGFGNITVYARENAAANNLVLPKPSLILNDLCDRLTALPAGDAYRAFITTDTTDLGHFRTDSPDTKLKAIVEKVLQSRQYRYGWWARNVAGLWGAVPVYEPRETTPYYRCAEGQGVTANLSPVGFSQKASHCRVLYKDAQGNTIYTDVTDADDSHLLVKRGLTRWTSTSVDTTDLAVAQAAGAAKLAEEGRSPVTGSIEVAAKVMANGALIEPCELEAGHLIAYAHEGGESVGRIASIAHTGRMTATLTLEGSPLAPRRLLQRLMPPAATGWRPGDRRFYWRP